MPQIAVYGSLRKQMYNNTRFPMEFMMTTVIDGFQLYDLGPYPMVVKTGNIEDTVVIEVYHVTSRTKESIDAMEEGAGYILLEVPITNEVMATIYAYDHIPEKSKQIKSGDYVKYIHQGKIETPVAPTTTEIA